MSMQLLLISENENLRGELQFHLNHMAPHRFQLVRISTDPALNFIDTLAIDNLPACIFIDVQYPLVGLSTMKSIRQRDPLFKLPVVALLATSITRSSIVGRIVDYSQQDYQCLVLHLPIANASLRQVVEKLNKLKNQQ